MSSTARTNGPAGRHRNQGTHVSTIDLQQFCAERSLARHERLMAELSAAESATLVTAVEKLTRFLDRDEKVLPAPMPRDAAAEPARAKRR